MHQWSQLVTILTVHALSLFIAPFLCHPNLWIRYGAVGFITVVAQHLNVADIYCKLMPHLNPFITQPIVFRTASLVQDALEVHPLKVSTEGKPLGGNVTNNEH